MANDIEKIKVELPDPELVSLDEGDGSLDHFYYAIGIGV